MEEQNQPLPCPIAGEPASPCRCENFTPRLECLCCGDSLELVRPTAGEPALMALRATLHRALRDYAETMDGWNAAADDLATSVKAAHAHVTTMLGITEPADEDDEDPYAGDAEGEMRAEAEAERRADAALELAAELASCDWEGWN